MHLQYAMSSIFDWEVRQLGMRERVKTRNENSPDLYIFYKNYRFLWEKYVTKTNFGSTIHYTYTSYMYKKYFRLCMVSEELQLNEIGLFL